MRLAIDFDGVIHDHKHPVKKMGPPIDGAIEALQDLHGHYIIIHSTMASTPSGRKAVADWLEYFDIDYNELVGKPKADYYIDDHAIEFKTWPQTKRRLRVE